MPASPEARNVADARAALYRIKQARQPITEAIEQLQEHIEHLTKQLADTRVVDDAMREAEDRAQWALDEALAQHEDAAAERVRLQIEAEELRKRREGVSMHDSAAAQGIHIVIAEKHQRDIDAAVEQATRKIADNPQA